MRHTVSYRARRTPREIGVFSTGVQDLWSRVYEKV
jgi:hypothetical protein